MIKEIKQAEWLKMLDERDECTKDGKGGHGFRSARIGLDGRIESVGVGGHGLMFQFSGSVEPEMMGFAGEGRREFFFADDDTVSLLVGLPKDFSVPPVKIPNLSMAYPTIGIVPRDKWIADYVGVYQHKAATGVCGSDSAPLSVKPVAIEVNRFRVPVAVIAEAKFKLFETETDITPQDILCFTYGLSRHDLNYWGANVGSTTAPEAYFNNDLDLVYNADPTRFRHNRGYHGDYFEKRGIPIPSVANEAA